MSKILVTGGCGYIGSHTIADLVAHGYEIISVDNNSRSNPAILKGVELITGRKIKNYKVDLCNFDDTFAIFQENPDITGIIHLAAYKSVAESFVNPLLYFENNLSTLMNVLKCAQEFQVPHFIFSSSCAVYGDPGEMTVTEKTTPKPATSPFGYSKQMCEQIIIEFAKNTGINCTLLRYFNPAGAHPSAIIGEMPLGKPQNLVPAITQTAIGRQLKLTVYGTDYPTRDGSCTRDFVHVCDLAHAHTLCLHYLEEGKNNGGCEAFNLGSGKGVSVLEAIQLFEKLSGTTLYYDKGPRRPGDIMAIHANTDWARRQFGWEPQFSFEDILTSAWKWELRLKADETVFTSQSGELN